MILRLLKKNVMITSLAGTALIVGMAGTAVLITQKSPSATGPILAQGDPKVVARGRIEPDGRVRIVQGPTGAVLKTVFVRDGDVVAEGALLAQTDTYASRAAQVALEESRLVEAERQYQQTIAPAKRSEILAQKAVIEQRKAEFEKAEAEYKRTQQLAARGIVSPQTEQAQRAVRDEALHSTRQAESTYNSLTETREADALLALARVDVQKAVVAKAQADLELSVIRAPINGTVLTVMSRGGEALGADGLLQMADLDTLIVIAEVHETQIGHVIAGQPATITGAALSRPVAGTVSRVSHSVFKQRRPTSDILIGRDAKIIEVEIAASEPLPKVVGGEVTVTIGAAP